MAANPLTMTLLDHSAPAPTDSDHDFRIPFIVGITGHRDLDPADLPRLREVMETELRALERRLPNTPMIVLSPLAEGADRLAAQVAIQLGWEVIAPLPLPPKEYQSDFDSDASRAEFNHLLKQCLGYFTVPVPASALGDRTAAYEAVGRYIASHAQLILALWDGNVTTKAAGTSKIVHWRLTHTHNLGQPPLTPDPVASGPIVHIRTRRLSGQNVDGPFSVHWLYPPCTADGVDLRGADCAERSRTSYDERATRQDSYNAYVTSKLPSRQAIFQQSAERLSSGETMTQVSRSSRRLLNAYAAADALAIANQKHTLRTLILLCGLVLGAVVLYELVSHIWHPHGSPYNGVLVTFSLLLVAAICLLQQARKRAVQAHYQDCRALAEGLRVQFFWSAVGIVKSVASHYLNHARDLGWIRSALHGCACLGHAGTSLPPRFSLARLHWLQDQHSYFAKRLPEERRQSHCWETLKNLFLGTSIALGFLAAIIVSGGIKDWFWPARNAGTIRAVSGEMMHAPSWESWLLAGVGITLVLSAIAHFYGEKRAFAAHTRQYEPIRDLYAEALRRFDIIESDGSLLEAEKQHRLQDLLHELGCDALAENAEWLSAHRERPLEVPVP